MGRFSFFSNRDKREWWLMEREGYSLDMAREIARREFPNEQRGVGAARRFRSGRGLGREAPEGWENDLTEDDNGGGGGGGGGGGDADPELAAAIAASRASAEEDAMMRRNFLPNANAAIAAAAAAEAAAAAGGGGSMSIGELAIADAEEEAAAAAAGAAAAAAEAEAQAAEEARLNPCRAGGSAADPMNMSIYRCSACDGLEDPINYTPIQEGICGDKQCYDYAPVRQWLTGAAPGQIRGLPLDRRPITLAEWNAARARGPPNEATMAACGGAVGGGGGMFAQIGNYLGLWGGRRKTRRKRRRKKDKTRRKRRHRGKKTKRCLRKRCKKRRKTRRH